MLCKQCLKDIEDLNLNHTAPEMEMELDITDTYDLRTGKHVQYEGHYLICPDCGHVEGVSPKDIKDLLQEVDSIMNSRF